MGGERETLYSHFLSTQCSEREREREREREGSGEGEGEGGSQIHFPYFYEVIIWVKNV